MTKREIFQQVIERNKELLLELGIASIGLFGSVVRGDDSRASDFDILVEFQTDKKTFRAFNALCELLEANLGDKFDLVTRESLSPYMEESILHEAEITQIAS